MGLKNRLTITHSSEYDIEHEEGLDTVCIYVGQELVKEYCIYDTDPIRVKLGWKGAAQDLLFGVLYSTPAYERQCGASRQAAINMYNMAVNDGVCSVDLETGSRVNYDGE